MCDIINEVKDKKGKGSGTKDACYHKVKSRYSVWPSAYASGALVKCRKVGAANWGNKSEAYEVTNADKKGKGSGTKDACYHKVKSRYSVWPSAYASGALVKCRKVGAANWGNSSKKEEVEYADGLTEGKAKLVMKGLTSLQKVSKLGQKSAVAAGGIGVGVGAGKLVSDIVKPTDYSKYNKYNKVGLTTTTMKKEEYYDWRSTLDEKCWAGYEKKGMKTMFGKRYPNCVKKSKKKK